MISYDKKRQSFKINFFIKGQYKHMILQLTKSNSRFIIQHTFSTYFLSVKVDIDFGWALLLELVFFSSKINQQATLTKYLGGDMQINIDGTMDLKQPLLIERILKSICSEGENYESKTYIRPTPAVKPLLHKDLDGPNRKCSWNYNFLMQE